MIINKNKVVSVHYKLTEDSAEGELLEETFQTEPLQFIFGVGMMIPGFEENLEGKQQGDNFGFTLSPEDAYGDFDDEAVFSIPEEEFADEDGNIDKEKLVPGALITMHDVNGSEYYGHIVELDDEGYFTVDFNHPMAGRSLHFEGEVVLVREASSEELKELWEA
jgi:FKBP-type peptidyl-prolyl cis-trans isomerase SlyD